MKSTTKNKLISILRKFLLVLGFYWMLIVACSEPTDENWLYSSFGVLGFYGVNFLISALLLILGGAYDK